MAKSTFDNRPELIELEGEQMRINFDIEEVEEEFPSMEGEEPIKRTVYKTEVVRVPEGSDYSVLVDAIVRCHYDQSQMDAIRNNYELVRDGEAGEKEETYTEAYKEMQTWRTHAKEVAKEVLGMD